MADVLGIPLRDRDLQPQGVVPASVVNSRGGRRLVANVSVKALVIAVNR